MSNRMFVRPCKGLIVLNPMDHRELPATGAWVPNDSHWRRMLRMGDVVVGKPTLGKKPNKPKPSPEFNSQADEAQK